MVLTDLEVADVTTDGRPDALVADPATPGLGLLRGTGQGRLGPRVGSAMPGNAAATAVAVADFTNDGLPDAAVATVSASGNGLAVLRGPRRRDVRVERDHPRAGHRRDRRRLQR
ncbi:MAG: VCBS repeat-containing protein [Geodermatophilaceae bacterium]|nr:VCBS repeat-containing protein [Geodermatophilaceae bacterium]